MSDTIYYVYAYINKNTGKPYYIGKGKGNRAYAKRKAVPTPKNLKMIILCETQLTEIGAFAIERSLIKLWGRLNNGTGILQNKTDGGEGGAGRICTESHKKKISQSNKGKIGCWAGKLLSENHKNKISKSKAGIKRNDTVWNKGLKGKNNILDENARREKISNTLKGYRWWSKGSETTKSLVCPGEGWTLGRNCKNWMTQEYKIKMSLSCKAAKDNHVKN